MKSIIQPPLPSPAFENLSPRANGQANKLDPEDQAFHDWYRFVLSLPPHLVRHYIQAFELKNHHVVLDPFCGTGTTLIECKLSGLRRQLKSEERSSEKIQDLNDSTAG